jgi:3-hydroxybutyryl-CoA dehydratase
MTTDTITSVRVGDRIEGVPFAPTRESIRAFCEASLDFNPLHLDDDYMKGSFGRTSFGGIIMHGMNNFGVITKMLTDWLHAFGGVQRRLETRWKIPVKPGDTIVATGIVNAIRKTEKGRWATLDVSVRNQREELVAVGEAMVELPTTMVEQ